MDAEKPLTGLPGFLMTLLQILAALGMVLFYHGGGSLPWWVTMAWPH